MTIGVHLCCTKEKDIKNRMKEILELSDRLDKAKEHIYKLSHDPLAFGFKKMRGNGIRELCDQLYNEAKRFEQSAIDNMHDKNKFDFSVKYIEHFQKDLVVYIHRQPEDGVDFVGVTSEQSIRSVRPQYLTFEQWSLLQAGIRFRQISTPSGSNLTIQPGTLLFRLRPATK